MNENLDLRQILKDAPEGTKLWSPLYGVCTFIKVGNPEDYFYLDNGINPLNYPIICREAYFSKEGKIYLGHPNECVLFPSEQNHDWSTFKIENKNNNVRGKYFELKKFIKNEIVKNLKIKLTTEYDGYIEAKLLYKGKTISEDCRQIITDLF